MAGGRPRQFSLSQEEMCKLGEEMIQWVKTNNPIHLSQWYTIEKGYTYNEWKNFIQKQEFFPYYEKALKIVGLKYLDGTINPSISQRWQRVYFSDLRQSEDEDLNADAARRKDIEGVKPTQIIVKVTNDGLGSGLELRPTQLSAPVNPGP